MLHIRFLVMAQAVANSKTLLLSGGVAGGATASTPFPKQQKEYVFRTNVASYVSAWGSVEQQASQSSPIFRRPARVLPDVPLTMWKTKNGGSYPMAALYTLIVPT